MTAAVPEAAEQEYYVYGVVRADAELPADLVGVAGMPVRAEQVGALAVLVSDLQDYEVAGMPEDIRAHTGVLDTVAASCAVLPMAFGTVVPDFEELGETELTEDQDRYLKGLEQVAGAVQYTVRARYVQETVLAELVSEDPEIAQLREATAGQSEDATYYERVRLGELVVRGFERKRGDDEEGIVSALEEHALEVRTREPSAADGVLQAAVLVSRQATEAFEGLLERVAEARAERIKFRLVGPQAPYDFVPER